jgi:acyl-CoA synthetase (AMP-forming)/AMP-acid ligase II/acyl carrier protein
MKFINSQNTRRTLGGNMSLDFCAVANRHSDRLAIADETGTITYGELARTVSAVRTHLLSPGTVVMVALPGGIIFTALQLACMEAGAVFVAIPHLSTLHEAEYYLQLVSADVVVVGSCTEQSAVLQACPESATVVTVEPQSVELAGRQIVEWHNVLEGRCVRPEKRASIYPEEARSIQFTSGSTGKPKGVLLSEANWQATLEQNCEHLTRFEAQTVFCPLPQFHAMGNAVVMEHLFFGSSLLLATQFQPGTHVARMQERNCSAIQASPNYFKLMLRLGLLKQSVLPSLRSVTIGTASIDQELIRDLRAAFPDLVIHCRYGLSESVGCMVRLTLGPGEQLELQGLIGQPVPGVEVKQGLPYMGGDAEPGELRVRSAANAIGSITELDSWSPLVSDDGFLSTGDLVFATPEGKFVVRGRLSSFLKSNGYRINPFEIEEVLRAVPSVQEAVVVGVPDPVAEQRVVGCIEVSPGHTPPSTEALLAACEHALSAHKVPSRFLVLPTLPRTQAGKPDRKATLAAAVAAAAESTHEASNDSTSGNMADRVAAIVARVIAENVGRKVDLTLTTDLVEAGYLDSLTLVSLVVALQEELDVVIPIANLTPDQFASIENIVAYLASTGSDAMPTHHGHVYGRPARTPNRNFFLALSLAVLMIIGIATLPNEKTGMTARAFRIAKASCVGCADLVITGSSQAGMNLSPAAMEQVLPGVKVFNLGFSTQPYSTTYLDMIERSMSQSKRRAVLLVITPVSLVMRSNDDDAAYALTLINTPRIKSELDHLREDILPSRTPCELGLCSQHEMTWLLSDGWSPGVITGVGSFDDWQNRMQRFMRRWAAVMRFNPADTQPLLDRIHRWREQGIKVYAMPAPVPPSMHAAESTLSGYDEAAVAESFRSAGAEWVTIDGSDYPTFDGWHMQRPDAERFSQHVGRRLAVLGF